MDYTRDHYFSYPVFNEPIDRVLYCPECDIETSVRVVLSLGLELEPEE